jgi:hypothetical protein
VKNVNFGQVKFDQVIVCRKHLLITPPYAYNKILFGSIITEIMKP